MLLWSRGRALRRTLGETLHPRRSRGRPSLLAQARVVKRYLADHLTNHLDVQPVGPSPAIMHVDSLKKLAPLW